MKLRFQTHLIGGKWSQTIRDREALEHLAEGGQDAVGAALKLYASIRANPASVEALKLFTSTLGRNYRHHYPPCRSRVSLYPQLYPGATEQPTPIREIPELCSKLKWREAKHILLMGHVKNITLVTRKQKYAGQVVDTNQKFQNIVDRTATEGNRVLPRELFLLHVEDVNREKSVMLTLPVFPVLYEGATGHWEEYFKEAAANKFHRLLRFFGQSVPELRDASITNQMIKIQDKRKRMKELLSKLTGVPGKKAAHRFAFGVSIYRVDHDDVECVVNNVFATSV